MSRAVASAVLPFSWYLYSPHRIKHPLIRGRLLDLYRAERKTGKDPVEAWAAIQADPKKRLSYVGCTWSWRFCPHQMGRSQRNHCCRQYLHHQKMGSGSYFRLLADPGYVANFLRIRCALSFPDRWCLRFVLRLVLRPCRRPPRKLGVSRPTCRNRPIGTTLPTSSSPAPACDHATPGCPFRRSKRVTTVPKSLR